MASSNIFTALDFFAGSGLVTYALRPHFRVEWANDISVQKSYVYNSNHNRRHFILSDISNINGALLPNCDLSWASFPCQDLSLAGNGEGINADRSGLVWQWLRVMDEMNSSPDLLVAENVEGLISSNEGNNYLLLHTQLLERGYCVGAIKLDAKRWIPQSRPRIFVIAVKNDINIPKELVGNNANWLHNSSIKKISPQLENWIWWKLPIPRNNRPQFQNIVEWDAPVDDDRKTSNMLSMLSEKHREKLDALDNIALTGYKRTRDGVQRLELRFDGIAGCLRTPKGGSSRQIVLLKRNGIINTRLLTARETARLMGAPESYILPSNYNDAYMAMGDAVAVPVVKYLSANLLKPLVTAIKAQRTIKENEDVAAS